MPRVVNPVLSGEASFSVQSGFQVSSIRRTLSSTKQASGILKELLDDIAHYEIPGPYLIRLDCNEFSERLGEGSHFKVWGASESFKRRIRQNANPKIRRQVQRLNDFAVKQPKGEALTPRDSQENLKKVIDAAIREVKALGHSHFKENDALVRLLGWGLSLSDLEDNSDKGQKARPIVPLLIIERAEMTMTKFIANNHYSDCATDAARHRLYETYMRLCLDVGKAIGHIHSINQTHRDLKLDNILVFNTERGLRAKLCDFGLSGPENMGLQNEAYFGTAYWQPPRSRKLRSKNALKMCDIYVYGLVVWSAFTCNKDSPLRQSDAPHAAAQGDALELATYCRAKRELAASDLVSENDFDRILRVICHCIHPRKYLQKFQPWLLLDGRELPSRPLSDEPTPLMQFYEDYGDKLSRLASRARSANKILSSPTVILPYSYTRQKLYKVASKASDLVAKVMSHRQSGTTILPFHQAPDHLPSKLEIYLQELGTLQSCMGTAITLTELDLLNSIPHGSGMCPETQPHSYRPLIRILGHFQEQDLNHRLYAVARLRSRLCQVCWEAESHEIELHGYTHLANMIVMAPDLDVSTAAWLCRGAIAEHQIRSDPRHAVDVTYKAIMEACGEGGSRQHSSILLDAKFNMLVEMGLRLDQRVGELVPNQTIFSLILEQDLSLGLSDGDDMVELDISSCLPFAQALQRASRRSDCPPEYRYFLTGRDLGHEIVAHDGKPVEACTTALHEAALVGHRVMMRALLSLGVNINATDPSGNTPLFAVGQRKASTRLKVILKDLREHKDNLFREYEPRSFKDQKGKTLPLGWYESLKFASSDPIYVDQVTGSFTLRRPNFSLFQKKALTLPFQNLGAGHPDTLRVDTSRFSFTSAVGCQADLGEHLICDEWFEQDIRKVHTDHNNVISEASDDAGHLTDERTPLLSRPFAQSFAETLSSQQFDLKLLHHFTSQFPLLFGILANIPTVLWPLGSVALLLGITVPFIPISSSALSAIANLWALTLLIAWMDRVFSSALPNWTISCLLPPCCYEATVAFAGHSVHLKHFVMHGSIVSQFELLLGICIIAGGLRRGEQILDVQASSQASSMIFLGAVFQLLPLFFDMTTSRSHHSIQLLTNCIAIVSIILGLAYAWFATRSHADLYRTLPPGWENELYEDGEKEPAEIHLTLSSRIILSNIVLVVLVSAVQACRNILHAELPSAVYIFVMPVLVRAGPALRVILENFRDGSGAGVFAILHGTLALIFFVGPMSRLFDGGLDAKPLSPLILYAVAGLLLQSTVGRGSTSYIDGLVLLVMYSLSVLALSFTNDSA